MLGSYRVAFAGILAAAVSSLAAAVPPADFVRLPGVPAVPQPMPGPDAAVRLAADQLYVIDADVPFLAFASPKGAVTITRETGPLKIRGKFAGGTGFVETKTFSGKYVAIVESAAAGRVELIVVPEGAKVEGDAIRRLIDVEAGEGPRPPPVPKPDPKVEPKPDASPIPAKGLHVLILYDGGKVLPAAQHSILYGKQTRDFLEANCAAGPDGKTRQYRIWKADEDGYADSKLWGDAQKRPRQSLPWVVVGNAGRGGFEGPLPATVEEFLTLVARYK